MKNVRAIVEVCGRVQGVFFRAETKRAADGKGVKGWVKNLPNGNVQAVFEGSEEAVDSMLEWCDRGAPMSRVEGKEVAWEEFTGMFDGFKITY